MWYNAYQWQAIKLEFLDKSKTKQITHSREFYFSRTKLMNFMMSINEITDCKRERRWLSETIESELKKFFAHDIHVLT